MKSHIVSFVLFISLLFLLTSCDIFFSEDTPTDIDITDITDNSETVESTGIDDSETIETDEPPVPADEFAADYGVFSRKDYFYYEKNEEDEYEVNLVCYFLFDAAKKYDVTYTAKLLDNNGNEFQNWSKGGVFKAGTEDNSYYFRLLRCDDILAKGNEYKVRIIGSVTVDGKLKSWYWDYNFTHIPSINAYTSGDYGVDVKFNFLGYDSGDLRCELTLFATGDYDATYTVELLDPEGKKIYKWDSHTLFMGDESQTWKYSTNTKPAKNPGKYTYVIRGSVDVDQMQRRFKWEYFYTVE